MNCTRILRTDGWLSQELGLNSGINLRINAAELFAKPHAGVEWEDDLAERLASVEINSLDMSSNMYTKIDERDSTYIGGFTGMRANGTGMGSVMAVWMRKWSKYRSSDVTLVCGDQYRFTARAQQLMTKSVKATSGFTLSPQQGLVMLLGGEKELSPFIIAKNDIEFSRWDGFSMSSEVVRNGPEEGNRLKGGLKIDARQLGLNGEWQYMTSDAVRCHCKWGMAIPSMVQLRNFNTETALCIMNYPLKMIMLELGGVRMMTSHNAAAGVSVAATLDGVALLLKYERGPQKLTIPIQLTNELSALSFGIALASTASVVALLQYCVIEPRAQLELEKAAARSRVKHAEERKTQWEEADAHQRGMAGRARSQAAVAQATGGLWVCRAIYGVLPPQPPLDGEGATAAWGWEGDGTSDLLPMPEETERLPVPTDSLEPEPEPEAEREVGADCDRLWYDVTTSMQLRVESREATNRQVGGMPSPSPTSSGYAATMCRVQLNLFALPVAHQWLVWLTECIYTGG